MSHAFGGFRLTMFPELFGRSQPQDRLDHVLAVFLADGGLLKRPDERPEFRPNLRAAEKTAQLVFVSRKDILADVRRQMVVADKLSHSLEHFT